MIYPAGFTEGWQRCEVVFGEISSSFGDCFIYRMHIKKRGWKINCKKTRMGKGQGRNNKKNRLSRCRCEVAYAAR